MGHAELIYLMGAEEDASVIFTVDELLPPTEARDLRLDSLDDDDWTQAHISAPPNLPVRRRNRLREVPGLRFLRRTSRKQGGAL